APHNAAAVVMHLEHMFGCPFLGEPEDDLKYACNVAHEVDWVIVDHDIPRKIEQRRALGLFDDNGLGHSPSLLTWRGSASRGCRGCWRAGRSQKAFDLANPSPEGWMLRIVLHHFEHFAKGAIGLAECNVFVGAIPTQLGIGLLGELLLVEGRLVLYGFTLLFDLHVPVLKHPWITNGAEFRENDGIEHAVDIARGHLPLINLHQVFRVHGLCRLSGLAG